MITFLRKFVFHNFALKMVSLLAAVLLWVAVARDPMAEISVTVPLELQHIPENLQISTERIPQPQVWVRGPARMLRNLGPAEVHATLDLAGVKSGEHTYDLAGREIHTPTGVSVVQVVPAQLHLTFDVRKSAEVPIKARVLGIYAGASKAVISVEPSRAQIVGPEKRVRSIDAALTDAVDASGLSGRTTFSHVHIYVPDPLVQVVSPLTVNITVVDQTGAGQSAGAEQTSRNASRREH
jgi:YbbR domain-containing protein